MSQIKTTAFLGILALSLSLSGCGSSNSRTVFSPDSGKHPSGWSTGHKASVQRDSESCFECHGENLDGGISKISCTQCHLGTPGSMHPEQWGQYAYARHKAFVATYGTGRCANGACHGPALAGGTGGSSCADSCHIGGAMLKHPAWSGHGAYVKLNTNSSCSTRTCHGATLTGVFLSGQSCTSCHLGGISAVHPTTAGPWKDSDHKGYILTGMTIDQTRAKCDIAACHGTFNDAAKPGQIKVDKSCGASSCHAGDKN